MRFDVDTPLSLSLSPALRLTPTDTTLLWQKSTLHSELGEPRKALDTLHSLLKVSVCKGISIHNLIYGDPIGDPICDF